MKANPKYNISNPIFWAHIKIISERLGYLPRDNKGRRKYDSNKILDCFEKAGLNTNYLIKKTIADEARKSAFLKRIESYLNFRCQILEDYIQHCLMNREEARILFEKYYEEMKPKCHLPYNKQKGEKRHHAYLTCIVNMITEHIIGHDLFDDNPRGLTVFTKNGTLVRLLSRWMDGAYPSIINPHAIWEVKEYYGTTTFGSRVADGVYETMMDGLEIEEIRKNLKINVLHYLIIDDKLTWWDMGKSYLCRIVDMLHMGLIDEVIFGKEATESWPKIVRSWLAQPSM